MATTPTSTVRTQYDSMSSADLVKKYDLTRTLSKYLDRHFAIYLVHTLRSNDDTREAFSDKALFEAELALTKKTKKYEDEGRVIAESGYYNDEEQTKEDERIENKRLEDKQKLDAIREKCQPLLDILFPDDDFEQGFKNFCELFKSTNDESDSRTPFTLEQLQAKHDITKQHFEALYLFAREQFDMGEYSNAQFLLHYYTSVGELDRQIDARWGKLAADSLSGDWASALESIKHIQDIIEKGPQNYDTPAALLQARAWLMHWSLFSLFFYTTEDEKTERSEKSDEGLDKLVELWLPEMTSNQEKDNTASRYLSVIQTLCPHLIRYLAVAVIVGQEKTGRRTGQESGHIKMKIRNRDLARLVESERAYYNDPIIQFVRYLLSDCDLEGAHAVLPHCEKVMNADPLLSMHTDRFVRQARELIFESYCRIHSVMDIAMVAGMLGLDTVEAERYIVKMIRGAHLDAKIDSEANQVLLASQGSTFYRNIREKTKIVYDKTDQLIQRLQDRRIYDEEEKEQKEQPEKKEREPNRGPQRSMKDFSRN